MKKNQEIHHRKPNLPDTGPIKKLPLTIHHPSSIINKGICPKGITLSMAQYDEIVKHLMGRYAETYIGGNDARISLY